MSQQITTTANAKPQLGPTGQTVQIYPCVTQCGRNTIRKDGRCGACAQQLLLQQQEERQAAEAARLRQQMVADKNAAIAEGRQSLAKREAADKKKVQPKTVDKTEREWEKLVGAELKKLSGDASSPVPTVAQQKAPTPKVENVDPVVDAKAMADAAKANLTAARGKCPTERQRARAKAEQAETDLIKLKIAQFAATINGRYGKKPRRAA